MEVITSENGFGYREDDFSDAMNESAFKLDDNAFQVGGLINTGSDVDVFQFTLTEKSRLHLEALSIGINGTAEGANLDLQISIYNDKKELIAAYNPQDITGMNADTSLNAGNYYLLIEGVANANMMNYSSVGTYMIKASSVKIEQPKLELTGIVRNIKHQLETIVEPDENAFIIELESAEHGANFQRIGIINPSGTTLTTLTVNDNRQRYYRIKRTNQEGQVSFSKVIALTSEIPTTEAFAVNNFVHEAVRVQATESFQYGLYDINGRLLKKGNGAPGTNQIDLSGKANGVYIIRLMGVSQQKTVRLVKQ
jgi:hypothetical protein